MREKYNCYIYNQNSYFSHPPESYLLACCSVCQQNVWLSQKMYNEGSTSLSLQKLQDKLTESGNKEIQEITNKISPYIRRKFSKDINDKWGNHAEQSI